VTAHAPIIVASRRGVKRRHGGARRGEGFEGFEGDGGTLEGMVEHRILVAAIALGAAFCYAASNVIEQRKAAAAPPDTSLRIALLWYLARQPIWWAGIGVDVGGFGLQVLALGLGTLVFVQPLLVASLLFSLILGAAVGTLRLRRTDLGWAVVFMASLSIFLVVAAPGGGVDERDFGAWIVPLAIVAGLVLGALAVSRRLSGGYRAAAMAAAAGMTFGVSSTFMKSFAHLLGSVGVVDTLAHHWEPYALGLVIAAGFLILQSAFQAGDLRAALPFLEVSEPVVASVLGLTLMHERLHAIDGSSKAVVAVAVALMVVSAALLAHSAAAGRSATEPRVDLTDHPDQVDTEADIDLRHDSSTPDQTGHSLSGFGAHDGATGGTRRRR
jgi:hypothetical protein